jgi:hypothetical protein
MQMNNFTMVQAYQVGGVGTSKSLKDRQIDNEECNTFPSIVLGEQGSAKA